MYKIINTSLDYSKSYLIRKAPKLEMEPVLCGERLRMKASRLISDEQFENNKTNIEKWQGWGVVDIEHIDEPITGTQSHSPLKISDEVLMVETIEKLETALVESDQAVKETIEAFETLKEKPSKKAKK